MPTVPTDGQGAFQHFEPALMALDTLNPRLHAIVPEKIVRELNVEVAAMTTRLDTILRPYNAEAQAQLRDDLEAVLGLARATVWVQARYDRQILDVSELQRHVAEATPLHQLGLLNLDLLQNLKRLSPAAADAIRSGRGHADLAGDLQALGPLLTSHWDVLEPLQALRADVADRLTRPLIDRMVPLGTALAEADRRRRPADGDADWYQLLLRCHTLLEATWERLRGLAVGAYAFSGDAARAREGHPTLRSLTLRA